MKCKKLLLNTYKKCKINLESILQNEKPNWTWLKQTNKKINNSEYLHGNQCIWIIKNLLLFKGRLNWFCLMNDEYDIYRVREKEHVRNILKIFWKIVYSIALLLELWSYVKLCFLGTPRLRNLARYYFRILLSAFWWQI